MNFVPTQGNSRYLVLLSLFIFVLGAMQVRGQGKTTVVLEDFVGRWNIVLEKSYSSSERKDVSNYSLVISLSDQNLRVMRDYTIKGSRSHYSEILGFDKSGSALQRMNEWDPRAKVASFKKGKIRQEFDYGTSGQNTGVFLDYQEFSLSEDKKVLTIESVFRSARRFSPSETETKKLVFVKIE